MEVAAFLAARQPALIHQKHGHIAQRANDHRHRLCFESKRLQSFRGHVEMLQRIPRRVQVIKCDLLLLKMRQLRFYQTTRLIRNAWRTSHLSYQSAKYFFSGTGKRY